MTRNYEATKKMILLLNISLVLFPLALSSPASTPPLPIPLPQDHPATVVSRTI